VKSLKTFTNLVSDETSLQNGINETYLLLNMNDFAGYNNGVNIPVDGGRTKSL